MDDKSLKYVRPGAYDYRVNQVEKKPVAKLGQIFEDDKANRYIYLKVTNTAQGHVLDDIKYTFSNEEHTECHPTTENDSKYELISLTAGIPIPFNRYICFRLIDPVFNVGGGGGAGSMKSLSVAEGQDYVTVYPDGNGNIKWTGDGEYVKLGANNNEIAIYTLPNIDTVNNISAGESRKLNIAAGNNVTVQQSQASDGTINVTVGAAGAATGYRYETTSLMELITYACFAQGISFKDFIINGVPLYHPFEVFLKNGTATATSRSVGSDMIVMTYPTRMASYTGNVNVGLINTYSAAAVKANFVVYMENENEVRRDAQYDTSVNLQFAAFKEAFIEPYCVGYGHGIGMKSEYQDVTRVLTNGAGVIGGKTSDKILDMLGYANVSTDNLLKVVKSIQLDSLEPGSFEGGTIPAIKVIFDNISIVRKFTLGV